MWKEIKAEGDAAASVSGKPADHILEQSGAVDQITEEYVNISIAAAMVREVDLFI